MSKRPALRFKGYKKEWVQQKLGELVEIGDIDHRMPDTVADGIPYLMTGDFCGTNELNFSGVKTISESDYEQLSRKIKPEQGDIIFARYASVGAARFIDFSRRFLISYSCAIIKQSEKVNSKYLYHFITSIPAKKQIRLEVNAGTQANIGIDSMKNNIYVSLPSDGEQIKIADTLSKLDEVIILHQRKYDMLLTYKKAMLEKMFPKDGADVPEVRFAGFVGKWERCEFEEFFDLLSNNTLSRAELSYEQGKVCNVHYGDILVKFGEMIDLAVDRLPFIADVANISKNSFLQEGDVIIADTAEDSTVGKCSEITGISDTNVVSGLHTIPCRPKRQFAKGYLGYFMNSPAYHDQLLPLMQGTKVTSVSKSALQHTVLRYPVDIAEQTQIGCCFITLERLIILQKRKVDGLKKVKSALLNKMFI